MIKTRFSLKKIADLAILGLAVSIPSGFYFLTLPFLVVLALCRTAMKDERWKTGDFKTPVFILPAAFYLYVVIQFFFSHNKGEALSTLSSQLPFLLYPLILGTYRSIDAAMVRRAEKYFLYSVVGSLLIALIYAAFDIASSHQHTIVLGDAPYSKFSSYGLTRVFYNWHPTNVAMSAVHAIYILFRHYGQDLNKKKPLSFLGPAVTFLFLIGALILLNSITAIIAFFAILLYSALISLSRGGVSFAVRTGLLCILVAGAGTIFYLNPLKIDKIEELKDRDLKVTDRYEERNVLTIRLAKWQTHLQIIKDHLPWGTTQGDIKEIREAAYKRANFPDLALHNYNAHDQFIEYLTLYGIPGILLFLALLLAPLLATTYRQPYTGFLLIAVIIFLTESLLERQQGLNYFMFFYALYARGRVSAAEPRDGVRISFSNARTFVLILLAGLLIFQFFHNRSLWLDEAMLSLNIVQKNFIGLLHPLDYSQVAPLLFLWIEKSFVHLFGGTEMALRLFPLICGLLSLVLMYYVTLALTKNRYIALIACCLLGFTPKFIYYASEVKQYATDLVILLMIYFAAFSDHPFLRKHKTLLLSLAGALAVFTSNIAIIPLCTAGGWLLYQAIVRNRERKTVFIALPVWGLCFVVNYLLFIYHHPSEQVMKSYWAYAFMPKNPFGKEGLDWLGSRMHQIFGELLPQARQSGFDLYNIILYIGSVVWLLWAGQRRLVYLCVTPVLLHLCLSWLKMYPFDLRLILYQLPLYLVVMASGLYALPAAIAARKRSFGWLLAGLLTLSFSLPLFQQLPMDNEEFRPVILSVNKYITPGESAYIYYGGWAAYDYYRETGRARFGNAPVLVGKSHPDDNPAFAAELKDVKGHVWLLFTHVYPFDGSRGEERYMVGDLQKRGRVLRKFEAYNSSAYLMDLW